MKQKLKITFNAPVIHTFVMICFIATLLGVLTGGRITRSFLSKTYHSSLKNSMTYLRFFTHVFGPDGWSHFIWKCFLFIIVRANVGRKTWLWRIDGNFGLEGDKGMSEREEKFERMMQAVLDEYRTTVTKMEKLKGENKNKTVTYKQLMATKLTLQNIISRYEIYGLIDKDK